MTDEQSKPRRGCFFYGCLVSGLLLLVVMVAVLLGIGYGKKMLYKWTDTQPVPLPTVQIDAARLEALNQRIDAFQRALQQHRSTPPLTLSPDDVNALIATKPELKDLKGKFYLSIEGERLKGEVSIPMDRLRWRIFQGRYLNGTATFNLSFRDGSLRISPETIIVKGRPLPDLYMNKVRRQNLAGGLEDNPRASVALDTIQDIQIKDGKIVIIPKPEQAQ
jgi:hypothetical protein